MITLQAKTIKAMRPASFSRRRFLEALAIAFPGLVLISTKTTTEKYPAEVSPYPSDRKIRFL
ncbi:MAG: hypothetical protein ACI9MF_002979 [Gammaproteobacteria bacterium]|jgi:hypothetical protein